MNSTKILKHLSVYVLIALFTLNVFFFTQQQKEAQAMAQVNERNAELQAEAESAQQRLDLFSPTAREAHYKRMMKDARTFVHAAYVQQPEGYEKRREEAKTIMSPELLSRFFPTDTTYQNKITTAISNDQYFIQELLPDQKKIEIIVEFDHKLTYEATGNVDKSAVIVRIAFEKTDGRWTAVSVDDLAASTATEIEK